MVSPSSQRGFTLIELMTALAIIAVLLTLVSPRYFRALERSEETVLKHNLRALRDSIGSFHQDRDVYPRSLEDLVAQKYLSRIPLDPITKSSKTWIEIQANGEAGGLLDVKSGAPGESSEGIPYADF